MTRIEPLQAAHIGDAKRLIATVVLEFYFDGFTVQKLMDHYANTGYLSDIDSLEVMYDGRNGILLGVFDADELVGIGGVRMLTADVGELVRLWLLPSHRGLGLGRATVEKLLQFARCEGWSTLRLDTSRKCCDAIALFTKFGFRDVSPYKESIGDCFMELDLRRDISTTTSWVYPYEILKRQQDYARS